MDRVFVAWISIASLFASFGGCKPSSTKTANDYSANFIKPMWLAMGEPQHLSAPIKVVDGEYLFVFNFIITSPSLLEGKTEISVVTVDESGQESIFQSFNATEVEEPREHITVSARIEISRHLIGRNLALKVSSGERLLFRKQLLVSSSVQLIPNGGLP